MDTQSYFSDLSDDSVLSTTGTQKVDHPRLTDLRAIAKASGIKEHIRKKQTSASRRRTAPSPNRKSNRSNSMKVNQRASEICRETKRCYIKLLEKDVSAQEADLSNLKISKMIYLQQMAEMRERIAQLELQQQQTTLPMPAVDLDAIIDGCQDFRPPLSNTQTSPPLELLMEDDATVAIDESYSTDCSIPWEATTESFKNQQFSPVSIFETTPDSPLLVDLRRNAFCGM